MTQKHLFSNVSSYFEMSLFSSSLFLLEIKSPNFCAHTYMKKTFPFLLEIKSPNFCAHTYMKKSIFVFNINITFSSIEKITTITRTKKLKQKSIKYLEDAQKLIYIMLSARTPNYI